VHALGWYGGAFGTVRYDNLKAAAKKTLRGRRRVEDERFVALRSHYLFESYPADRQPRNSAFTACTDECAPAANHDPGDQRPPETLRSGLTP